MRFRRRRFLSYKRLFRSRRRRRVSYRTKFHNRAGILR